MVRLALVLSSAAVLAALSAPSPKAPRLSALWGPSGKSYQEGGRLPDFSWAGYHAGEELPNAKSSGSVRDFGARGDGKTDDTLAFQRAMDEAPPGVLLVPRGHYRLAGQLNLTRSGLVLRGEGAGASGTVLEFAASLADIQGLATLPTSNKFSWGGALLQVLPKGPDRTLTPVTSAAHRGDRRLHVADAGSIHRGDLLFLRLNEDRQRSLEQHLLGEADQGNAEPSQLQSTCAARVLDWTFQVTGVEGNDLILSQPLRTDVRLSWAPTVWRMPVVSEVGIEHLAIRFPSTPYPGHHRERGYNAIEFSHNVVNAWVRDVEVRNCDSGVFVGRRSKWLTVTGLHFLSARPGDAKGNQAHHGVALSGCSDVLATDLTFDAEFLHELTVTHRAMGNVFSGPARARSLDLDHHRDAPFENLFQDFTDNPRLQNGGSACYGPPAGARNTYWALDHLLVPAWLGTAAVVVGDVAQATSPAPASAWIERLPTIHPRDLRAAQRLRRQELEGKGRQAPPTTR